MKRGIVFFLLLMSSAMMPGLIAADKGNTKLVMLGTGNPNADPDRSGPAVAVVAGGHPYLVDSGPGVVRRASAARARGIEAFSQDKLDIVFITHLHSDHTLGLADLIFTPWVLERTTPLRIYGPPGIKAMADHLIAAYEEDIRIRVAGLEPTPDGGYKTEVHEIEPGKIYDDANVSVEAISVPHGSWKYAFAYKFVTDDLCIVISGDTASSKAIEEAATGCDYLVHEVYSDAGFARRDPEWQRYHASFHTSASQLAEIANRARPRTLVLYHQMHWGTSDADLLTEIRETYGGYVVSASDLDVFE